MSQIQVKNIFDVIMQTFGIMEREILKSANTGSRLVIQPELFGYLALRAFIRAKECINRGEMAAKEQIPELKKINCQIGVRRSKRSVSPIVR